MRKKRMLGCGTACVGALLVLTFAGCSADLDHQAEAQTQWTPPLKPRALGLMTREGLPPPQFTFIDSIALLVNWSDLETTQGVYTGPGWDKINQALSANGHYKVRLRIAAGVNAPVYVKKLGGPARALSQPIPVDCSQTGGVGVVDTEGKNSGCIPYFWTQPVQQRYKALLQHVAQTYGDQENLAEVVDGLCMTFFDEPFFRQHCQPDSAKNMAAAQFSFPLDRQCQAFAINTHAELFPRTRTSLAVNAWDEISSDGSCTTRFQEAQEFADWAKGILGERLVLQHNHLGPKDGCAPKGVGTAADTCYISQYPGPRGFQTETLENMGGDPVEQLTNTLRNAVAVGAQFVELPSHFEQVDTATLALFDEQLRAQAP